MSSRFCYRRQVKEHVWRFIERVLPLETIRESISI
jgi:hypothetical protein